MKIKKAVCFGDRTAERNILQSTSYRGTQKMSNLKESIGEILLYLQFPLEQKQQQKGWDLLEILLMQYVKTKIRGEKL